MKKILKDTLALFLITLISGVLLGFVYKITKEPIKEQELKTKLAAYQTVFSELDTTKEADEDTLNKAQTADNYGKGFQRLWRRYPYDSGN